VPVRIRLVTPISMGRSLWGCSGQNGFQFVKMFSRLDQNGGSNQLPQTSTASASENRPYHAQGNSFQNVVKKVGEHGRKHMTFESATNDAQQNCKKRTQGMHFSKPENGQDRDYIFQEKLHGDFGAKYPVRVRAIIPSRPWFGITSTRTSRQRPSRSTRVGSYPIRY